ncbi:MAG: trypsin-like peptidase domain-containing protein [Acidimicrobiales bacterium]|nr:trypsin-like peptidase domain-containing protein [Acidimicrobiales bacterium]
MSPPREHPGSDASFADSSRFSELRSRLANRTGNGSGAGTAELSIDDVLGGSLDAPRGQGTTTEEVSAAELLDWFEAPAHTVAVPPRPDSGDRLPVLAQPTALVEGDAAAEATPTVVRPSGPRNRYHRRRWGAAPFVKPSARRSRRKRRRDYRQLGFVELTPEKLRLRHRILPRTVLGASMLLVALGVGAAFSGASFYAYYDWRTSQSEAQNKSFAEDFQLTFTNAQEQLQLTRNQAIEEINGSLEPLRTWANDSNAVAELPAKVGGGVFFVRTLDPAGKPSVGTAFVVSSSPNESLLLTSYQVVAAATAKPAPTLTIEKGGDSFTGEVWAWDAAHDIALLKTSRGSLPQLEWASDAEQAQTAGKRVYAISGSGGQGATASPGLAVDASQVGIRHDTPLSPEFRGGPLTNASGQVLGLVSIGYQPTGIDAGELTFSPYIVMACAEVLRCPESVTATTSAPTATSAAPQVPTGEQPTAAAGAAPATPTTATTIRN